MERITILGVGNVLLTDDGVGVRVVEALEQNFTFPPNVELYDGGTGGLSLLPVIEKADFLIVVDAVLVDEPPGTILRFDFEDLPSNLKRRLSAHEIDVIDLLTMAEALGKRPPTVIIGVQPRDVSTYGIELTVQEQIPELVDTVLGELKDLGIEVVPKHNRKDAQDEFQRRSRG